ncbi:hypothetical protein evm_007173 [Chilo suppressalis]|nr:hypothetical protein evm_007173 [Chilo suppressalis]
MFHRGKYYVTFKHGFEENKKDINVTIDKVFQTDVLKITLSDEDDPAFLCIVTLSRIDYEELKKQQGLLIDFDNFPSQLVRLLQQCATNNMFLQMQQSNPMQYFLEIIEHNEFKRLVHLSLKTGPATDADIKGHMAETIINLKKTLSALKMSASNSDALWSDKCVNLERKLHDLTLALSKLEEDKHRRETEHQDLIKQERDRLSQDKLQWQSTLEKNFNAQLAKSQEHLNRKDKQIEDLNINCKQLRENIGHLETQLSEKAQRTNVLEKEVQKTHIEVATLKARNTTLERELGEKEKVGNQLNCRCTYLEQTVKDQSETIKDLNMTLQMLKKEKTSLEERLSLSESLASKKAEAAHSTSDQLLKANQIISKQNSDLIEIKEKLLCRTAIVLEQEKVIETNSKEIEQLKSEVYTTNQKLEKLKEELSDLMDKYKMNEQALKDRDETIKNNNMVIQWLHKKMDQNYETADRPLKHDIHVGSTSTPYFLAKNNKNNTSEEVSDMSINFYGTSKSNIDDSAGPQSEENNAKIGLDPKYLRPATDENRKQVNNGECEILFVELFTESRLLSLI